MNGDSETYDPRRVVHHAAPVLAIGNARAQSSGRARQQLPEAGRGLEGRFVVKHQPEVESAEEEETQRDAERHQHATMKTERSNYATTESGLNVVAEEG